MLEALTEILTALAQHLLTAKEDQLRAEVRHLGQALQQLGTALQHVGAEPQTSPPEHSLTPVPELKLHTEEPVALSERSSGEPLATREQLKQFEEFARAGFQSQEPPSIPAPL